MVKHRYGRRVNAISYHVEMALKEELFRRSLEKYADSRLDINDLFYERWHAMVNMWEYVGTWLEDSRR